MQERASPSEEVIARNVAPRFDDAARWVGGWAGARPRGGAQVMALFGVLAYGFTLYALWIGLDFGRHWDEPGKYDLVVASYKSGVLLPHFYKYPSMIYWISLASVADRLAVSIISFLQTVPHPITPAVPFDLDFFLMRARALAMVISSLGAGWIFLALRASPITNKAVAAAFGLALYLFSWEFGYHARWLAPDMIVAQFVALFVLCLVKAERNEPGSGWITGAAIVAGLAISTKYTAVGLIVALWLYVLVSRRLSGRALALALIRQSLIAVAVYLAVTPGTLLDPVRFIQDVRFEMHHYATGHTVFHGATPYDIHGFWLYLARMWEYLGLAMLSPQPAISGALAALALWGLMPTWRRSRPIASTLAFLLVFYSLLFSRQAAFIVRNFLMLLPVFCYLASVGLDAILERAQATTGPQRNVAVLAVTSTVAVMMGWNAWEQLAFGRSIVTARQVPLVLQAARYLRDHPAIAIALSPKLSADLAATGMTLPPNAVARVTPQRFLFRASELSQTNAQLAHWPATRHDSYEWLGAREVNLNYYPNWAGRDHLFVLDMDRARRMGVVAALETTSREQP
jgi:hypothetical protein